MVGILFFPFKFSVVRERCNGNQVVFGDLVSKSASFSCEHFFQEFPCVTAQMESNRGPIFFVYTTHLKI